MEDYILIGHLMTSYNEKKEQLYRAQLLEGEINILHEDNNLLPVRLSSEAKNKSLYAKAPPEWLGALEGGIVMNNGTTSTRPTHSGGVFWHESENGQSGVLTDDSVS